MQNENAEILSSSSDNQAAPNIPSTPVNPPAEQPEVKAEPMTEVETSEKTAEEKPEFADPNMQARFTQRMTEIKASESKIKAFDFLAKDPKFLDWYQNSYKQPQQPEQFQSPEVSDEEFYAATTSREAMQQLLTKQISSAISYLTENNIKPQIQEIKQQFEQREQSFKLKEVEQEIQDFASTTDEAGEKMYPDFWELDEKGLIEPQLAVLAHVPENVLPAREKLKLAYQLAKYPQMGKQAVAKAHDIVSAKKKAVGERGTGQGNVVAKKMSKREFYEKQAAELGVS